MGPPLGNEDGNDTGQEKKGADIKGFDFDYADSDN